MKQDISNTNDALELLDEIKVSLERDAGLIIETYLDYFDKTKIGAGFYAIPRLIFPEIDNLGSYLAGNIENTSLNAIRFMKTYFSKINPDYKLKSAFIYYVYRHGLMHQHVPKFVSYKNNNVGWKIRISKPNTNSSHLQLHGKTIIIDGRKFFEDTLNALNEYKKDIVNNNRNVLNNLVIAHRIMMQPEKKSNLLRKKYINQTDLNFFKKP